MRMPGFNGDASLYQTSRSYRAAGGLDRSVGTIRPVVLSTALSSCISYCDGDPDCIFCCRCVSRGGHPSHCCF
jgi:hypothetical protein